MRDKIIEILNSESFHITNEEGQGFKVVESDDFDDVADRILKFLNNKHKAYCTAVIDSCQYCIENKECKYQVHCHLQRVIY